MHKTSKVVLISYNCGLLSLAFVSARGKFDKLLADYNRDGCNLAEVIPDNPNLIIWVFRIIILFLTFGL